MFFTIPKFGEYDKALTILAEISQEAFTMDSLKYTLVKTDILEKQGNQSGNYSVVTIKVS